MNSGHVTHGFGNMGHENLLVFLFWFGFFIYVEFCQTLYNSMQNMIAGEDDFQVL